MRRRIGAVVLVLLACGGCASAGTSATNSLSESSSLSESLSSSLSASLPAAPQVPKARNACDAFSNFMLKLYKLTPHGSQPVLVAYAQAVQAQAMKHGSRKLLNDAVNLVSYVGAPSFPTEGTPFGRPIQALQNDCP